MHDDDKYLLINDNQQYLCDIYKSKLFHGGYNHEPLFTKIKAIALIFRSSYDAELTAQRFNLSIERL